MFSTLQTTDFHHRKLMLNKTLISNEKRDIVQTLYLIKKILAVEEEFTENMEKNVLIEMTNMKKAIKKLILLSVNKIDIQNYCIGEMERRKLNSDLVKDLIMQLTK